MCYSLESNYNNWLLACAISMGLLATQTDKDLVWAAIFTLTFSQIQIAEALLWANPKVDIVKYMVPLLLLQPTVQSAMGYNTTKNPFLFYLTIVSILALIYSTFRAFTTDTFNVTLSQNHHLVWNRYRNEKKIEFLDNKLIKFIYGCGLFFPLLFMNNKKLKYSLITFGFVSFLLSHSASPDEFSSLWCFYSVGYIGVAAATLFI